MIQNLSHAPSTVNVAFEWLVLYSLELWFDSRDKFHLPNFSHGLRHPFVNCFIPHRTKRIIHTRPHIRRYRPFNRAVEEAVLKST